MKCVTVYACTLIIFASGGVLLAQSSWSPHVTDSVPRRKIDTVTLHLQRHYFFFGFEAEAVPTYNTGWSFGYCFNADKK